jgi:hypothetical protein
MDFKSELPPSVTPRGKFPYIFLIDRKGELDISP